MAEQAVQIVPLAMEFYAAVPNYDGIAKALLLSSHFFGLLWCGSLPAAVASLKRRGPAGEKLIDELGGAQAGELRRQCGLLDAELRYGRIDDILAIGLHEYLTSFLQRIYAIGDLVNTTYFWSFDGREHAA